MIALAADAVLVLIVIEGLVLAAVFRRTRRGVPPRLLLGNLGSGFMLVAALRLAAAGSANNGATAGPIALCLLAALLFHVVDLAMRWRNH